MFGGFELFAQCGFTGMQTQVLRGSSFPIQNTGNVPGSVKIINGNYPLTIGVSDQNTSGVSNGKNFSPSEEGDIISTSTTLLGLYEVELSNLAGCVDTVMVEVTVDPTCGAGGLLLSSQQEVNDFPINFPDCTEFVGNLSVGNINSGPGSNLSNITDLSPLAQLIDIGGDLTIRGNPNLTNLNGLQNISSVDGILTIISNNSLLNLDELSQITNLNDFLYLGFNSALNDISGLDGIPSVPDGKLYLVGNTSLSTCEIPLVCDYVENDPNTSDITFNATGCNTPAEVLAACSLLPVELINFQAKPNENNIALTWQTITETNNAGFLLQRSTDSRTWEDLVWKPGAGTTDRPKNYRYTDSDPKKGVNYYRLAQEDFDGTVSFSRIISAQWGGKKSLQVYPNPSLGIVNVNLPQAGILEVISSLGRVLGRYDMEAGTQQIDLRGFGHGWFVLRSAGQAVRVEIQ